MQKGAVFSDSRVYRYALTRYWGARERPLWSEMVNFICLNPSTADENVDDATVRRCIGFSKAWGCDGLVMTNLFAFRATSPKVMKAQRQEAVGQKNNYYIRKTATNCTIVVCAWGTHGSFLGRDQEVQVMLRKAKVALCVLGLTKGGLPKHPLFLPKTLVHVPWK